MTLLKYGSDLIKVGSTLLGYINTAPSFVNGAWKHKTTGVWTELQELYPHYGNNGGVIAFNGYANTEPTSIANVAHNISELIIREGCNVINNINLTQNPDTSEWMYQDLIRLDLPSTITHVGEEDAPIFGGLANVTHLIIRATTPPYLNLGTMQSANALIYVPDASIPAYSSSSYWGAYSSLLRPISDL